MHLLELISLTYRRKKKRRDRRDDTRAIRTPVCFIKLATCSGYCDCGRSIRTFLTSPGFLFLLFKDAFRGDPNRIAV